MMRRGVAAALLALAAVLTAGGCDDDTTTVSTGDEPSRFDRRAERIVADWPERVRPVSGRHGDMLPLEGAELPRGHDGERFVVRVGHGACDADYGAHVRETDKVVVVAGWAVKKKDVDVCTDQLLLDNVDVKLEKDLGDRPVVDAATGKALLNG
ncbi:hypothetical protein [Streptomyces sp. NPDC051776]|uniref:hypothetical protein n=1 Tax=Streptomyces sp. NPDC051776 TaxID=3155414 RepID=UPI0034448511